jgi:hypothetical protein
VRIIILIVSLLFPGTTQAQVQLVAPSPPPVNQEGMNNFCIYGNQIYSLGAQLCVPNSNGGMRCVASDGAKSNGRAYWSFDNPSSSGWRCGSGDVAR